MSIRDHYLNLLKTLIAIPSVSAQQSHLPEAATCIADAFRLLGAEVIYDDTYFAPFIMAQLHSPHPDAQTIVIYNHYDVQPAEPLALWQTDPWSLTSHDDKLFGRGVDDDKGNLTARMAAVAEYIDEHETLPVNIVFIVEGSEETASRYLQEYLVKHTQGLTADLVIWESGGKNDDGVLEIFGGNKGIVTFDLAVTTANTDLHSSLAGVVDSAAIRLSQAIATLFDKHGRIIVPHFFDDVLPPNQREKDLVAALAITPESLIEKYNLNAPLYTNRYDADFKEILYFQPTISIEGLISGYNGKGVKTVLPAQAHAKLESRLVPNMSPESTIQHINNHLVSQGFPDITLTMTLGQPGYRSDMSHPEIARVINVARQYYHAEPSVMPTSPGTGPMAIIHDALQAPIASLGIGYAQTYDHAPNENVRLSDYNEHIDVIKALINSYNESKHKIINH